VNSSGKFDPLSDFHVVWSVTPRQMDVFWAEGWRHFGPLFFRRYFMEHGGQLKAVQPLRIDLERFAASKSQRRVLRRNLDLSCQVRPTVLDDELRHVFALHSERFPHGEPPILENFLGLQPDTVPCENVTLAVYAGIELVAASFLDIGDEAVSSIYGIFQPRYGRRSLGIFTMLKEIEFGQEHGCRYYYPGYACHESSPYDYKKQFAALEWFDWQGNWKSLNS
jgi:arginine-tRNA-protein transferase